MIGLLKAIYKIMHYLILNTFVGLIVSVLVYVVTGNIKISIFMFIVMLAGGLFVEGKG